MQTTHQTQHSGLTAGLQALRALARHRDRTAFRWEGGEMSYRAATALIGRMHKVPIEQGLSRGMRVGILSANRADSWCAQVAVHLCGAVTTGMHPKGSLADHVEMLVSSRLDDVMLTRAFTGLETNMLKPSIIAAGLDPDNLPANISEERAAALYGGGKGKQGPKRWLDVWGAGHSVSGVTGIPSVAELVAATAREYEGARRETAKLF